MEEGLKKAVSDACFGGGSFCFADLELFELCAFCSVEPTEQVAKLAAAEVAAFFGLSQTVSIAVRVRESAAARLSAAAAISPAPSLTVSHTFSVTVNAKH